MRIAASTKRSNEDYRSDPRRPQGRASHRTIGSSSIRSMNSLCHPIASGARRCSLRRVLSIAIGAAPLLWRRSHTFHDQPSAASDGSETKLDGTGKRVEPPAATATPCLPRSTDRSIHAGGDPSRSRSSHVHPLPPGLRQRARANASRSRSVDRRDRPVLTSTPCPVTDTASPRKNIA